MKTISIAVAALLGYSQAVKLSYDSAGGLLGEPEFMREHPEWKLDNMLSVDNEKMRQRPDHYLVGINGDLVGYNMNYGDVSGHSPVGGNSQFETKYLLGPDAEGQKVRQEHFLAQTNGDLTNYNMNYDGNSYVGGNKQFETKYLLGPDAEGQKQRIDHYLA